MGNKCAHLLANLFLHSYDADFKQEASVIIWYHDSLYRWSHLSEPSVKFCDEMLVLVKMRQELREILFIG